MNWLDHENSPRKRPPLSHGVQSIARVQPLVPEVSMWMSSHGILDQSVEEPVQREGEPTVCPEPQKFDGAIRSLVVQPNDIQCHSSETTNPLPIPTTSTASTTQGDLYQLLQSQSEQIASLHEALRKLILDRSTDPSPTNRVEMREIGVQTQPKGDQRAFANQATQCQLEDEIAKPHFISPGKVESPSQSNADSKECEDVLDQLQRACMRGSSEKAIDRGRASDSVGDTMSRLRNLGISFVDRNHLKEGQVPETRFDSNYPLGLKALGETTHFSTVQSIASDSSLAINSAALKYLDDRQLTALANNRGTRRNGAVDSAMRDSGVTQYGLPMQQLSMHTKNYLENATEASSRPREGRKDILENLTQLLQQPKLRP